MWRAALKGLFAKKLRLLLTAASIVLGVGFVAGTYVLTDTMARAFDQLFATVASDTDVVVRAASAFEVTGQGAGGDGTSGRRPIPASVLETVRAVQGVAEARPSVQGYAQLVDPRTGEAIGGFGPPTIGLSWDPGSTVLTLREGRAPQGPGEVVVDAGTARAHDLRVGQEVRVITTGGPQRFEIVGIAGFGETDNLAGATLALFELRTAQELFDRVGRYDEIAVDAAEGVSASELRARIQARLPEGVEAVTSTTVAAENADAFKEALGFFRTALLVFAGISLFVGSFIIFNTFSIITAQRTRELALLRALGATRRQVTASVLLEAVVVGLAASVVGVAAGVGIAAGLRALLGAFGVDLPGTALRVLPRTVLVSVAVGSAVTLMGSLLPARRAARVAPVEALRDRSEQPTGGGMRRRLLAGTALTAVGLAVLLFGLFGGSGSAAELVGAGAALTFLGVAALSPIVARPAALVLGRPLRALGVPGRLGQENAMRNPRRTAATAAALMVGLALVSMVSILSASLKASFTAALEETLRADLTVTTSSFQPFSPEVAERIRALPEVAAVAEFRQGLFRFRGEALLVTAVDPSTIERVAALDLREGSVASLAQGRVLVSADAARERGISLGDRLTLTFPGTGPEPLVVGGLHGEDRLVGDWVVSLATYERLYPEQLDTFVLLKGAEGVSPRALQAAVERAVADFPSLDVQDQAAFREKQAGFVDQLLNLVTVLLLLAVVIALVGIANTLGLSILERTREIGLLRAIGMTRRQLRSAVRWEAVIIAVFGALLGLVVGLGFGVALQRALAGEGLGELAIPAGRLVVSVVLAGLAGVVAAVGPARRAARLDVLRAIAYE